MLDSHEFRRDVLGEGDNFGRLPLSVTVLSEEVLLEKLGRWGIFRGGVGEGSAWCTVPLYTGFVSFSGVAVGAG